MLAAEGLLRRIGALEIVRDVSLNIARGESVSLVGPSGCGKTTLLQMIGLLDRPTSGRVLLDGESAWDRNAGARARMRLARIGFVFQQHNLFAFLSARENVALPAWRLGGSRKTALERADELLARFGLAERAGTRAGVLSMGEQQRVAIARALVNRPALVLADEPTGSLDSEATERVLSALEETRAEGAALLLVTHDLAVAARAGRRVTMRDGRLSEPSAA